MKEKKSFLHNVRDNTFIADLYLSHSKRNKNVDIKFTAHDAFLE